MSSELYRKLSQEAHEFGDTDNCAVIAYAVSTGCGYRTAAEALSMEGRQWQKGAHDRQLVSALSAAGLAVTEVARLRHIWQRERVRAMLIPANDFAWLHGKALATAQGFLKCAPEIRAFNRPGTTVLVSYNDHIAAYQQGELHDWSHPTWRKRVEKLYLVEKLKCC